MGAPGGLRGREPPRDLARDVPGGRWAPQDGRKRAKTSLQNFQKLRQKSRVLALIRDFSSAVWRVAHGGGWVAFSDGKRNIGTERALTNTRPPRDSEQSLASTEDACDNKQKLASAELQDARDSEQKLIRIDHPRPASTKDARLHLGHRRAPHRDS